MIPRTCLRFVIAALCLSAAAAARAQPAVQPTTVTKLADIRMRDVCILPDQVSNTYYMVGPARRGVRAYTSKDLVNWEGPQIIFRAPDDVWDKIPVVSIWAPELHAYKGKYYLFLTFDTRNKFPEQWRNWYPRVTRGSQVLAADAPTGPFKPFANHSTLPADMMTFDGKLMNVLHSPNSRDARPRIFEMKDNGDTLRIVNEFTGELP